METIASIIAWTIAMYVVLTYITSWLALPFIVWIVGKDRGWHQGREELRRDHRLPRLAVARHGK